MTTKIATSSGRILDVTCFCGKLLKTWPAYRDHFMMKHPDAVREQKESGDWITTEVQFSRATGWGEELDEPTPSPTRTA